MYMTELNIQMKQRNSSGAWDNLYPKTKGALVTTNGGTTTVDDHVNDSSKHIQSTGNITESTSSVLTITGGSNAVLGTGATIQVKQATSAQSGYLSNTDWSTFNNKQAALGYTAVNKAGDTMTGDLTLKGDPTSALHAATKQYVDAVKQGLDVKDSVKVATTTNITLSATQTIDGIAVVIGDRVLVKDQTTAAQNGIYIVASGTWTRAGDFDGVGGDLSSGAFTFVEQGTANGGNGYVLTTANPITVGTSSLAFSQFSGAGQITAGTGLSKSGNTLSLANTAVTVGTYKSVTVNQQGQVTAGTNPTTLAGYGITDAAPSSHVGATGSAHGAVTTSVNGFMLSTDKSKLDGIASNATATASSTTNGNIKINGTETTVYTHPSDANTRHVSDTQIATWNGKQNNILVSATEPASPAVGDLYYAIV
jgi:hypothetical protein